MATLKRDLTMEQQLSRAPMDLPFLMLVVLLSVIGVITVFSASFPTAVGEGNSPYHYFIRQAVFAGTGMVALYFTSKVNYQAFRWLSVLALGAAFFLLLLVLIPGFHTQRSDGVKRWLDFRVFTFQPSEAAKLGVILTFSAMMSKREGRKKREFDKTTYAGMALSWLEEIGFLELVPYACILGAMIILMYFEPHLSGMILIIIPAAAILFVGGISILWFLAGGAAVGSILWIIAHTTDYMAKRLAIHDDPWAYPREGGYQIIQSLYSIGSGGLFGVGFGQGRQKQGFLPEAENDFIFSVWCEEMGMVGAALVLILFMLLIIRGYWIALHARDRFGTLLVVGITTLMAAQVVLNIAVVTNIIPTTGVSLPFFSYGGSAILVQLIEMGIVLGVSRQIQAPRQG